MNFSKYLLPRYCKIIGLLLLAVSLFMSVDHYYFGHKYHFLKWRVFTFYSEFLRTRTFSMTKNNQTEEVMAVAAIIGLALIAFSKEKIENHTVNRYRLRALVISFLLNTVVSFLGTLLFHGLGYFYFLLVLLLIPMVSYYFIFQYYYWKNRGKLLEC